jgi:hypothetical protein
VFIGENDEQLQKNVRHFVLPFGGEKWEGDVRSRTFAPSLSQMVGSRSKIETRIN